MSAAITLVYRLFESRAEPPQLFDSLRNSKYYVDTQLLEEVMKKLFTSAILVVLLLTAANVIDYVFFNHDWKSTVDLNLGIFAGVFGLTPVLSRTQKK